MARTTLTQDLEDEAGQEPGPASACLAALGLTWPCTLEQVKAARPTRDYDPRWGATSGFNTTDNFVEAVYKTLQPPPRATRARR